MATKLDYVNFFPFYRCTGCRSLVTEYQVQKRVPVGGYCACGSRSFSPTDLLWYEWLRPSVWAMIWGRLTGDLINAPRS